MGDLVLSGGGSTSVSTEALLENARRLRALASSSDDGATRARRLRVEMPALTTVPADPRPTLRQVEKTLSWAGQECHDLVRQLHSAAESYGEAERSARSRLEAGGAFLAHLAGRYWPLTALGVGVGAVSVGILVVLVRAARGLAPEAVEKEEDAWAAASESELSDPRVVGLVRLLASSADDGILGAAGAPYGVARDLDDRALGWYGLHGAAASIVGVAGVVGALAATRVRVRSVGASTARAPLGYVQLAERVPPSTAGGPQVRIEKYASTRGRPSWIVYVGGTIDEGFVPGREPWDDTSNLRGVARLDPASLRATRQAMAQAGVRRGDSVTAVGYSQGGIVATALAQGGQADTLVTFGSPTAGERIPEAVPDVAVEHTEDLIPALGGEPRPADEGGLHRLLVRQSIFDGHPPARAGALPAHKLATYEATAHQMDLSEDPRLRDVTARIERQTRSGTADVTLWHAERVASGSRAGPAPTAAGS